MTRYLEALPDSSTIVLYFTVQRQTEVEVTPVLHETCKRWNPDIPGCDDDLLVVRGRGSDGYVYLYRTSALEYRVFLEGDTVVAYEPTESPYARVGGALRAVDEARWGDHWTVGLFISFHMRNLMLDSHKTRYIPSEEQPNQVQILRTGCNTIFDSPIEEATACVVDGVPNPDVTLGAMFRNQEQYVLPLLQRIKAIYQGEIEPQKGGNATCYMWWNGRRYRVRKGARGGRYLLLKNGRKKYISSRALQSGGAEEDSLLNERGDRLEEDFVQFLAEQLVRPLADLRPELTSVFLVYDRDSDGFMVRHNFGEDEGREGALFHIDKGLARRAFGYATMSQEVRMSLSPEVREQQEVDLATFRTQFFSAGGALLIEGVA